jgi:hypothetical protein
VIFNPCQCYQLLANGFGQINQKIWSLGKKFGCARYFLKDANIISVFKA